jgi:hypothetical protein
MGEGRNVYRVLVGKPEGKRSLERARRRWEDGIEMDLREIGWGCGVDSRGSVYGPLAGCCECGDEPLGSGATELVTYRDAYRFTRLWEMKGKEETSWHFEMKSQKNCRWTDQSNFCTTQF